MNDSNKEKNLLKSFLGRSRENWGRKFLGHMLRKRVIRSLAFNNFAFATRFPCENKLKSVCLEVVFIEVLTSSPDRTLRRREHRVNCSHEDIVDEIVDKVTEDFPFVL